MKQFRKGDRVRRTGYTFDKIKKGRIYTVFSTSVLDTIRLEGETGWWDADKFELETTLKSGMVPGAWVRRTGPGRDDVVSGGSYQIETIREHSMTLVGCEGSYCFGKFEVIDGPAKPTPKFLGWKLADGTVTQNHHAAAMQLAYSKPIEPVFA